MVDTDLQHSNISEEEMGQIHSIHLSENAIAAVRRNIRTGPSLEECTDCGLDIPLQRRQAVSGCLRCIHCQTVYEHRR